MNIRVFRCSCDHRMRYGVSSCGYCFRPSPLWNRWWLPPLLLLAGLAWAVLSYLPL